jgi:hypothetical protein
MKIGETLKELGYEFERGPVESKQGASADLRDPDGYFIFFDTHVSEKGILDTMEVKY